MKLLLTMACVFLVLEKNSPTNGKPVFANDNLTYRLMQIETDADANSENQWTSYPVYDEEAYASEYVVPRVQANFAGKRRRRPSTGNNYDNQNEQPFDDEVISEDDNHQNDIRSTTKKKVRVRDEDASTLRIPVRRPKRITRKQKSKKSKKRGFRFPKPTDEDLKPSKTGIKVDKNNNYDQREEEEEEEMEEEKEKIRKVTIKKKRPTKNVTRVFDPVDETYKTVQPKPVARVPNRVRPKSTPPPVFRPAASKKHPSAVKDNAERFGPSFYKNQVASSTSTQPHKGAIKPRDVNFVLRGKNPTGPRVIIRRYKQFMAPMPINGYAHLNRAKLNKYRFAPKKRKKIALRPFPTRQLCVKTLPQKMAASVGAERYKTLYPYSYADYGNDDSNIDNDGNSMSVHQNHMPESFRESDAMSEHQQHVPESFRASAQQNAVAPRGPKGKNRRPTTSTTEEPMAIPYDVQEHKNTEELADVHAKETDENIDQEQETDPIGYEDIEVEGVDSVDDGESGGDHDQNTEYDGDTEDAGHDSDSIIETSSRRPNKRKL